MLVMNAASRTDKSGGHRGVKLPEDFIDWLLWTWGREEEDAGSTPTT